MRRRLNEYDLRLLCPLGSTQQAFFDYVRNFCIDPYFIRCNISEWIFFPFRLAPNDKKERLQQELTHIDAGPFVLNEPRIHALLAGQRGSRRVTTSRIMEAARRPLARIRSTTAWQLRHTTREPIACARAPQRPLNDSRREGLRETVAALAGHRFSGSATALSRVWRLSPDMWMYAAWRAGRTEGGWRRARTQDHASRCSRSATT